MEKFLEEKRGLFKNFEFPRDVYFIIGILVVLFLIFFSLSLRTAGNAEGKFLKCGDGSFSGYCSLSRSYFCNNTTLIENPAFCGCPESFDFDGKNCVSDYDSSITDIYLDYAVYGVNNSLYFKYREDVLDYLLALPKYQVYSADEIPKRSDFRFQKINDPVQSDFLKPLVVEIENLYPSSKDMQAKVAVSLVQNIPYNESEFISFFGTKVRVSKFPYEVIGKSQGSCEGKSALLAYLLKELGFGVTLFYYQNESHETVGIKCPLKESYLETGYCFVETTVPSPITFSDGIYLGIGGGGKLESEPEITLVSEGISLGENLEDYNDADVLKGLTRRIEESGTLNLFEAEKMNYLRDKYGLTY